MIKKEKGITLIALSVTIIVLIILSGVTILSIINADGMYRTIKKAQEDTQIG